MGLQRWMCCLIIIWINVYPAYASKPQAPLNRSQSLMDVYSKSIGQGQEDMHKFIEGKLIETNTYGYVKPYVPIMQQPIVRKVWIPDHKSQEDGDILVAGHWTYVMVEGPRWFIDTAQEQQQAAVIIPQVPHVKE